MKGGPRVQKLRKGALPAEMEAMEGFDGFPTAVDVPDDANLASSGPRVLWSHAPDSLEILRRPHKIPGPWPQERGSVVKPNGHEKAGPAASGRPLTPVRYYSGAVSPRFYSIQPFP